MVAALVFFLYFHLVIHLETHFMSLDVSNACSWGQYKMIQYNNQTSQRQKDREDTSDFSRGLGAVLLY